MQGYQQASARHARVVDNTLYIDFNYIGYASEYTGTITGIEFYGCDPDTGDVLETLTFPDITDWVYTNAVYPLQATTLDPNKAWRGKLTYNLVSSQSAGENMSDTIDFPVHTSRTVEIVSIDGTPVNLIPLVSSSYTELANSEHLTSVLYDVEAYSVSYESHSAVVSVDGVEHNLTFDMIGT